MYVLFIFRRDLRVRDNLALNLAIEFARDNDCKLILAFTFTKEQATTTTNAYFSQNAFQFMVESLIDLNDKVDNTMSFFEDKDFYRTLKDIKAIAFNTDYTPYACARDQEIEDYCKSQTITLLTAEDYTLHPIDSVKTLDGNVYKVFTPFYKMCMQIHTVDKPKSLRLRPQENVVRKGTLNSLDKYYKNINTHLSVNGNRDKALNVLTAIKNGVYDNYKDKRDDPSHPNSTTRLSAYLKFGNISVREAYFAIKKRYGKHNDLIKQLYWKEFYANIAYNYSHVLKGMTTHMKEDNSESLNNVTFVLELNDIKWTFDERKFEKWCKGNTGFPLVDAGMRQMNKTGFMHNRLRMVTASFLIKDLHIDWRRGERYFATQLVDYDPASNSGGWQWVAGTGTDASPYFRIFNPWIQIKNFDKDCKYIKQWIPELEDVKPTHIMKWFDRHKEYEDINYPKPIVDHDIQKKLVAKLYQ